MALRPCATQGCAKNDITKNAMKMQVFFLVFFNFFVIFFIGSVPHIASVPFGSI